MDTEISVTTDFSIHHFILDINCPFLIMSSLSILLRFVSLLSVWLHTVATECTDRPIVNTLREYEYECVK